MSLLLELGTKPHGLSVKTFGIGDETGAEVVFIGDYQISMRDFLITAWYVLTNSSLTEGDPRLQFLECVRSMQVTEGFSGLEGKTETGVKSLHTDIPPILDT